MEPSAGRGQKKNTVLKESERSSQPPLFVFLFVSVERIEDVSLFSSVCGFTLELLQTVALGSNGINKGNKGIRCLSTTAELLGG